jgi:hypothetical protein
MSLEERRAFTDVKIRYCDSLEKPHNEAERSNITDRHAGVKTYMVEDLFSNGASHINIEMKSKSESTNSRNDHTRSQYNFRAKIQPQKCNHHF